ncbi:MAG: hypothetical protein WCW31_03500 [Patescibacteria group bacterium]|jgi:hypothetical protein
MANTIEERLAISLIRYDECLRGDFLYADNLAKELCDRKGLWTPFCQGVIKNHGRITREQIRTKILGFLCSQAQNAMDICRRGQNWLHDIHSDVEACQYFLVIFCGPKPRHALIGELGKVSSDDLDMVLPLTHQILGINGDQVRELVLKFGRDYVKHCRKGRVSKVRELVLLGGNFELDIQEIGSSAAEVRQWLFAADLQRVNNAYKSLMKKSLHELLVDKCASEHLQIVTNCLDPDPAMWATKDAPWYMRSKPITAGDLNLQPEDFEYIQRVQRAFEASDSV